MPRLTLAALLRQRSCFTASHRRSRWVSIKRSRSAVRLRSSNHAHALYPRPHADSALSLLAEYRMSRYGVSPNMLILPPCVHGRIEPCLPLRPRRAALTARTPLACAGRCCSTWRSLRSRSLVRPIAARTPRPARPFRPSLTTAFRPRSLQGGRPRRRGALRGGRGRLRGPRLPRLRRLHQRAL